MEWSDVRCFLAVARTGTLAAAGPVVHVDASTVGRRIAALEASLGVRLFDHTRDGYVLTPAGHEVMPAAEGMEAAAAELVGAAGAKDRRVEGVVRVASSDTMGRCFLAPRLGRVREELPGIHIELVTGAAAVNVVRREADIAVRLAPIPTQPSVVARKVGVAAWGLFHAPGVDPATAPVIDFVDEMATVPGARWLAEHLPDRPRRFRSNNLMTAAVACAAGWGLAAIPTLAAWEYPELVRLPDALPVADVYLVLHAGARSTARVRAVAEVIAAVFAEARELPAR